MPNPPATFLGREAELRAVHAALERANVVVVCGVGGLGKTSLATAAVKKHLGARLDAAVMVGLRPQPFQQALVEILRALAQLADRSDDDWSAMATEEELITVAIDLAERRSAVVFLDDIHHALPHATGLLLAVARYARSSTWVVTSRIEPEGEDLVGQIVRLGPLPDKKLAELARLIDPDMKKDAVKASIEAAGGSPWRLRRLLGSETQRESPLEGIDDHGRAVLEALFVAERPLAIEMLSRVVGHDVKETASDLVRRGLAENVAGGLRLHEAARPWVAEQVPDTTKAREGVARALAETGSLAEILEALRLTIEIGDEAGAIAICDRHGARLVRGGYAPTLWKLLESRDAPAWQPWKLRAGLQVASVDITRTLAPPPADALVDRLLFTRALFVAGRPIEADEAASRLATDASTAGARDVVFWAGLLRAMAVHNHAGAEKGVRIVRALAPVDPGAERLRDLILAFWLVECGEAEEALAIVESAPHSLPSDRLPVDVLGAPVPFFIRFYRFAALMESGRLDEAHAVISAVPADLGEELSAARIAGNALANLAVARGRLDEAKTRLGRLERANAPPAFADVTAILSLERRLAAGELAGFAADLDALVRDAKDRTPQVHAWATDTHERHAIAIGSRAPSPLALDDLPLGRGTRAIFGLRRALRRARWGDDATLPDARDTEGKIIHASIVATRALLGGRHDEAIAEAKRAIELANADGWAIRALEATALLAECGVVAGDDKIVRDAAAAIASGAPRFALEASFFVLASATRFDAVALEELGARADTAPTAARRARALLGDDVSLDAVDRLVVDRARARAGVKVRTFAPADRRGWGLDVERKLLYRADGTTASLEKHALLMRMLVVLAERGGSATFEQIAEDVWRIKSFHPLKDTNRVRVTMHRLRALVETGDGEPRHIVLRDAAYAIGEGPFRLIESVER